MTTYPISGADTGILHWNPQRNPRRNTAAIPPYLLLIEISKSNTAAIPPYLLLVEISNGEIFYMNHLAFGSPFSTPDSGCTSRIWNF